MFQSIPRPGTCSLFYASIFSNTIVAHLVWTISWCLLSTGALIGFSALGYERFAVRVLSSLEGRMFADWSIHSSTPNRCTTRLVSVAFSYTYIPDQSLPRHVLTNQALTYSTTASELRMYPLLFPRYACSIPMVDLEVSLPRPFWHRTHIPSASRWHL
jgi:hypothetical protein